MNTLAILKMAKLEFKKQNTDRYKVITCLTDLNRLLREESNDVTNQSDVNNDQNNDPDD